MMKEEIDESIIDIVNIFNNNGVKTYYSCDGVYSHHEGYNPMPSSAYIIME